MFTSFGQWSKNCKLAILNKRCLRVLGSCPKLVNTQYLTLNLLRRCFKITIDNKLMLRGYESYIRGTITYMFWENLKKRRRPKWDRQNGEVGYTSTTQYKRVLKKHSKKINDQTTGTKVGKYGYKPNNYNLDKNDKIES